MAVGVLALQGSFNEHIAALRRLGVKSVEIRKPEQLHSVTSLIIPGGKVPPWPSLLSVTTWTENRRTRTDRGPRLYRASKLLRQSAKEDGPTSFRGVFIRAPAILEVGPEVEVLADILAPSGKTIDSNCACESQEENTGSEKKVIVAVKQGNLLGTTFHPELTADTRWHSYFLKMVSEVEEGTSSCISTSGEHLSFYQQPMSDLPIFQ